MPGAVVASALLLTPFLIFLGPALRNRIWGTALCLAIAMLLLLGNPIKIAMLRMPLSIADLQALPVLFKTMTGARLALGVGILVTLIAVLVLMLRMQHRTLPSLAFAICYVIALPTMAAWLSPLTDTALPVNTEEREMFNGVTIKADQTQEPVPFLQARGPILYLAKDWLNTFADNEGPSREEVDALKLTPWTPVGQAPNRNIHVVLLESLWDTSLLAHHHTDRDPMDPRFRAMWEAAGRSYALSPEFGSATANAEFEVLCGFPAPRSSVAFVNRLRKASPCLPAVMGAYGYHTVASHAHEARNWNRVKAYNEVGFDLYRPITSFELDDMEGPYLYDGSFFRQNLQYLDALEKSIPVFNYQVSLSSHWAYARNLKVRPDLVKVTPADMPLLNDYVNAVSYTTSALMNWTEKILAKDPDAIIVAFGDHAPVLINDASDKDPYLGANAGDSARFDSPGTRRHVGISRTPLLIIDGERGPVKLDQDTPLYEIPNQISAVLGGGELLPQSAQTTGPMIIRPFLGYLLTGLNGTWQNCAENSELGSSAVCGEARERAELLRSLRRDTIQGGGYFVRNMNAEALLTHTRRVGMNVDKTFSACEFDVNRYGPQQGLVGSGFQPQPDGSNTMWINLNMLRGTPTIRVAGVVGKPVYGDKLITASFSDTPKFKASGVLPVTMQCDDQQPVLVGEIEIMPAP
jgi:hypothetical protein